MDNVIADGTTTTRQDMAHVEENKTYTETGVTVPVPSVGKSADRLKILNEKLCLYREIALTALRLEVESSESSSHCYCFDAVAGTGIAGLQWKKHLGDKVTVTCGDRSNGCVKHSCDMNRVTAADWNRVDCSQRDMKTPQGPEQIYVSSLPTKVLLQSEAFDFVYLQVHGHISSYIDSVLSNMRAGGVACFLFPNISSQCFRSPKLIQRQFYAHTQKTVYVTEMAARIVVGDIVRTAGRHGRAVDVICTLYAENHFFIMVKINKNSQMAGDSIEKCRPILHCLMCEERAVYPETHCPVEMPYGLLPCECKSQNPGRTAVILGPMWIGEIFDVSFLKKIAERMKTDFPKSKANTLLNTVITEAVCESVLYSLGVSSWTESSNSSSANTDEPVCKRPKLDNQSDSLNKDNEENQSESFNNNNAENQSDNWKKKNTENQSEGLNMDNRQNQSQSLSKHNEESHSEGFDKDATESIVCTETGHELNGGKIVKETKKDKDVHHKFEEMPIFYYHLHQQRYSVVPRSELVVTRLKEAGFRASRTHFEPHSIRTNATQKQMHTIIERTTKQKKH